MRVGEIRALPTQELVRQLDGAHRELFNLRFRLATKQLANHREIRKVRKKLARMNTILRERELASVMSASMPSSQPGAVTEG